MFKVKLKAIKSNLKEIILDFRFIFIKKKKIPTTSSTWKNHAPLQANP